MVFLTPLLRGAFLLLLLFGFAHPRVLDLKNTPFANRKISRYAEKLSGEELVAYVNSHQNLWKAELNTKTNNYGPGAKRGLMGTVKVRHSAEAKNILSATKDLKMDIPKSFDARQRWPDCASIREVRDQSSCGSCWSFGATEAMSDRICIASKGKLQVRLSAADLLSCCTECGFGCNGGDPLSAWKFWVTDGIVTGSNFTQNAGCRPYPFPPCEHHSNKTHFQPCPHDLFPTPQCQRSCQSSYDRAYDEDKYFGASAYAVADDVEAIQKELMTHGPVEIAFDVHEDFLSYAGGIYFHQAGASEGGHAVKLIGWGEEHGIPFWLVVNSWNEDWGERGLFRILRGVDECGIESGVVGGLPKLN